MFHYFRSNDDSLRIALLDLKMKPKVLDEMLGPRSEYGSRSDVIGGISKGRSDWHLGYRSEGP